MCGPVLGALSSARAGTVVKRRSVRCGNAAESIESGEWREDDAMCNIKNMCAQNDVKSVNGSVENYNLEEKLGGKGMDIQEARHKSSRILAASKT